MKKEEGGRSNRRQGKKNSLEMVMQYIRNPAAHPAIIEDGLEQSPEGLEELGIMSLDSTSRAVVTYTHTRAILFHVLIPTHQKTITVTDFEDSQCSTRNNVLS